jgi:ribose/xylose/arabinose/galactoside ABC-type transport system permease subunit
MRHRHSDGKPTLVSALSGADNVSGARIHRWSTRAPSALAFRKIGALYILIVIIGIFSLWAPSTFPKWATVQQVCDTDSILALAALSPIVPLSAGLFDLSIPYTMTLSGVVVADLVAKSTPLWLAVVVAMLVSLRSESLTPRS